MLKHRNIIYLIGGIALIVLWELSSYYSKSEIFISSPTRIYFYFIENADFLLISALFTLGESFVGFLIAVCFSFILMILCFYFTRLLDLLMPIMVTSQVIPLIVLAPLFIMLMGSGFFSKVLMASVLSFFPVFINFGTGVKTISSDIMDLMKIYNAPKRYVITHVFFPLSLPSILSGMKLAATLSVIGAIVAEFSGAEVGLGKNLFLAAIRLEPELMMTSLILSAFIGLSMFSLVSLYEKKKGKWFLNDKNV